MASYTYTEKSTLLTTPIEEVLTYFGKDTSHTRSNLYLSPIRDEKAPSFHVDPRKNLWYDFGSGEGGGVLDLVMKLKGCNRGDAMDVLAKISRTFIPSLPERPVRSPGQAAKPSGITVIRVYESFSNWSLRGYISERGISLQTAARWCRQLLYSTGNQARQFYGIGFANDAGGWVIRSRYSKKCSVNGISSLMAEDDGDIHTVAVFEGFMDFLSWWEYNGLTELPCNVCVLNSVVNAPKATGWLKEHRTVDLFLDNDEAGRRTTKDIIDSCEGEGKTVNDMSDLYRPYKDYNEMLLQERRNTSSTFNTAERNGTDHYKGRPGKTGKNQLG